MFVATLSKLAFSEIIVLLAKPAGLVMLTVIIVDTVRVLARLAQATKIALLEIVLMEEINAHLVEVVMPVKYAQITDALTLMCGHAHQT
jgi:hypothetical protein